MRISGLVLLCALACLAAAAPGAAAAARPATTSAVVDHVADGDTIKVAIGDREEYVRFIGIDTPEVYEQVECGGPEASASMDRMLGPGDRVRLVRDRTQGNRDDYGRLLRYVQFDGRDLGEEQVRRGWASVYVFDDPFKRLGAYNRAAAGAEHGNRGAWHACGGI